LEAIKSICEVNKSIVKHELQKDVSILESIARNRNYINDVIKYLAEHGANLNAVDSGGRYLLHLQIAEGNLKVAKAFIENGADVNVVNQEEDGYWMSAIDANALKGQTVLHFTIRAYENNRVRNPGKADEALEFISYLIEKEANLNIKDCGRKAPLDTAMFFNAPEIVELLIKAGADLHTEKNTAEDILRYAITKEHIGIGKAVIRYILGHDSRWLTRLNKPDLLSGQEELSSYWDEYRAQVVKLHDTIGDKIDLTGDGSTRPIMRTLSSFLDDSSRKNLIKASLILNLSDDRNSQTSEGLCPKKTRCYKCSCNVLCFSTIFSRSINERFCCWSWHSIGIGSCRCSCRCWNWTFDQCSSRSVLRCSASWLKLKRCRLSKFYNRGIFFSHFIILPHSGPMEPTLIMQRKVG
jgi:ankyrin repeat protein